MLTKQLLTTILDRLDYWLEIDRKTQKAMDDYCSVVAPSSYSPILERSAAIGFIEGVVECLPEIKEELSYYAYELPSMKTATGTIGKKKFNLKNRDEYIDFILCFLKPEAPNAQARQGDQELGS